MAAQKGKTKWLEGDNKLLNRSKDGLIPYFGKYDVTKITPGMVREYLLHLDENRNQPLAGSTKSKHVIIIRKVLTLAVEDGLMQTLPPMPKVKTEDTPRHTFTDSEYKRFCNAAAECAKRGDTVRGVQITGHHVKMFKFVVHSFLRPAGERQLWAALAELARSQLLHVLHQCAQDHPLPDDQGGSIWQTRSSTAASGFVAKCF
nr:phage integrase SAM-like domain-containing protein [Roseobacter sp. HKCCD8431]